MWVQTPNTMAGARVRAGLREAPVYGPMANTPADRARPMASGPVEGTKVVTDGAAELFGTEFVTGR